MVERGVSEKDVEETLRLGAPTPAFGNCKNAWATVNGRRIRVTFEVLDISHKIVTVAVDEEAR
jgi:hypothetical protein